MSPTTHRILRRLRRVAGTVVLTAVTLVAAGFVLAGALGLQRYVIVGGSMTGTYDLGSVVFDRAVPVPDLRVGDVITYQPPPSARVDHLVTHRIISIRHIHGETVYHTKGDANPAPDPWRFRLDSGTQPRVVFAVPYVGYLFAALTHRWVRIAAIGLPAALLALWSLVEFGRMVRPAPESPQRLTIPAQRSEPAPARLTRNSTR